MRYPIIFGCMVAAFAIVTAQMGAFADDKDKDKDNNNAPATKTPIKHVVVIFQENASFDHYFGTYPEALNPSGETQIHGRQRYAQGEQSSASEGLEDQNPNSLLSLPFRLGPQNAFTCSEDHGYSDEQSAAHAGAMDMFQDTSHTGTGCQSATQGPFAIANPTDSGFPGTFKAAPTVMAYFDGNTVTALWNYAQNFAMSDNSFDSVYGPSTNGAINLVSGQTHGAIVETASSARNAFAGTGDDARRGVCRQSGHRRRHPVRRYRPVLRRLLARHHGEVPRQEHRRPFERKSVTWGWFAGGFAPTVTAAENNGIAVCGASHAGHPGVASRTRSSAARRQHAHPVTDYSSTTSVPVLPVDLESAPFAVQQGEQDRPDRPSQPPVRPQRPVHGDRRGRAAGGLVRQDGGLPGRPSGELGSVVGAKRDRDRGQRADASVAIGTVRPSSSAGTIRRMVRPPVRADRELLRTQFDFLNGNSQCGTTAGGDGLPGPLRLRSPAAVPGDLALGEDQLHRSHA